MGTWGQQMWLSDRDYLDGMTAAATAPVQGFAVVNLMSDNPGMRWSLGAMARPMALSRTALIRCLERHGFAALSLDIGPEVSLVATTAGGRLFGP